MLFNTTLNQMLVLVTFIAIGFALQKCKVVPDNSSTVISKLENNLFIPALVLNALMYTSGIVDNFGIVLFGLIVVAITMAIGFFIVISLTKEKICKPFTVTGFIFPTSRLWEMQL